MWCMQQHGWSQWVQQLHDTPARLSAWTHSMVAVACPSDCILRFCLKKKSVLFSISVQELYHVFCRGIGKGMLGLPFGIFVHSRT